MVELDEAMRRALSEHYGPGPGAKGRVLDGLRAQLTGPGGPDGSSDSSGSSGPAAPTGGQAAWAAKVVAATLSLTGAGLLTIKLGALAVASLASPAPPTPAATIASVDSSSAPAPELDASAAGPAAISFAADRPEPEPAPAPTRVRGLSTPTQPIANSSDLAAELALVRAAEQWRERDPHAALAKLEQHRSEFAAGALAPEREVLRVELLCALERREQARAARDAFMATRSDPQLRARIEASCVGTGSEQSGN